MRPWVHIGHAPLLVLLVIAATACLILIAEIRFGVRGGLLKTRSPGQRLTFALAGLVATWIAFAIMVLIAGFIGFGFGPFYLLASAAFVMFIAIPAFAIPPVNRVIERLSFWQAVLWAAAVIVICLTLAFLYLVVAIKAGIPMRFSA
jgi:hypothetical protein